MVAFNKSPNPTSDPNYLGMSQGPGVDKAIGGLFSDIASIGTQAVQLTDNVIQKNIKEKWYGEFDKLMEGYGVNDVADVAAAGVNPTGVRGDPTLFPNDTDTPRAGQGVPAGVARLPSKISTIQEKYRSGAYGQTEFDGKVYALVRQLRAEYPGYREQIDQMVAQTLSRDHANDVRKRVMADLDAAERARAAETSKDENFIRNNAKYLTPEIVEARRQNKVSTPEVIDFIHKRQIAEQEINSEKASLSLMKQRNEMSSDAAERSALSIFSRRARDHLSTTQFTIGASKGMTFDQMMRSAQTGGMKMSPQDISAIHAQGTAAIQNLEAQMWAEASAPINSQGDTILSLTGQEKTKKAIEAALAGHKAQLGFISKEQFTLVQADKVMKDVAENRADAAILEAGGPLAELGAIRRNGGEAAVNLWLQDTSGVKDSKGRDITNLSRVVQALRARSLGSSANGEGRAPAEIVTDPRTSSMSTSDKSKFAAVTVRDHLGAGLDPQTPRETAVGFLKPLFSPNNQNFISLWNARDGLNLFNRMVSPDVSKRIASLSDPELSNNYIKWAGDSAVLLFKEKFDTATNSILVDDRFRFSWNPSTNQVDFVLDPKFANDPRASRWMSSEYTRPVQEINRVIKSLESVYRAQGQDPGTSLYRLLQSGGFDLNAKDNSFLKQIGKSIRKSIPNLFPEEQNFDDLGAPKAPEKRSELNLDLPALAQDDALGRLIGKAESSGSGYSAIFGGSVEGLTKMTVAEVQQFQKDYIRETGKESSAIGYFQTVQKTLNRAVKALGIPPDQKFDEETQTRIGEWLIMKDAGGEKFLAGDISKSEFADRLAGVWAGLPLASGRSRYAGVGSNKATVSRAEVLKAIDEWQADKLGFRRLASR